MRYQYSSTKMAKIQDSDLTKCWQVCKELGHLYIDSGNIECYSCFGTHFGNLFKKNNNNTFYFLSY